MISKYHLWIRLQNKPFLALRWRFRNRREKPIDRGVNLQERQALAEQLRYRISIVLLKLACCNYNGTSLRVGDKKAMIVFIKRGSREQISLWRVEVTGNPWGTKNPSALPFRHEQLEQTRNFLASDMDIRCNLCSSGAVCVSHTQTPWRVQFSSVLITESRVMEEDEVLGT